MKDSERFLNVIEKIETAGITEPDEALDYIATDLYEIAKKFTGELEISHMESYKNSLADFPDTRGKMIYAWMDLLDKIGRAPTEYHAIIAIHIILPVVVEYHKIYTDENHPIAKQN